MKGLGYHACPLPPLTQSISRTKSLCILPSMAGALTSASPDEEVSNSTFFFPVEMETEVNIHQHSEVDIITSVSF